MEKVKILAIDGNADNLIVIKAIIAVAFPQATLISSLSIKEGIELCLSENPDVLLLDMEMPEMEGCEVCKILKTNHSTKSIPVVMLTSVQTDSESRIKALELGADAFLAKPVDKSELIAQIRAMLRIKESEDRKLDEKERLESLVIERTRQLELELSERRKVEEALYESEGKYRSMVELMPDAVIIHEAGKIVFANAASLKAVGAESVNQMVERALIEYVHPDFRTMALDRIKKIYSSSQASEFSEEKFITLKNEVINVEVIGLPIMYMGRPAIQTIIRDITGRKLAEEAIKASEAQFREFFEKAADAIFIADTESGIIVDANEAASKLLLMPHNQIVGLHQSQIHPKTKEKLSKETFSKHDKLVKQNLPMIPSENEIVRSDGSLVPVEIMASEVIYQNKKCLMGTFRDITERKKAEKLLRESEYFFRESQRAAFVGSYKFDLEADYWTSSEVLEQIFGIDKNYNRSLHGWQEIIHPDDREMMAQYFMKEVVAKRQPFNKEYRIISQLDGEFRWVLGLGKLNFDAEDNVIEMIGTIQDITERKQVEENLKESQQLFMGLLNASPDAILLIDPHHPTVLWPIVDCNEAACQMNGYTREEMVGQSIDMLNESKGTFEEHISYINYLRREGVFHTETIHRHKDGHNFPVEISTTIVTIGGHEMILGIDRDITERKQAEVSLKESEERYRLFISQLSEGVYRFECDQPMDLNLPVEEQVDFIYDHMHIAECNKAFQKMYGISDEKEMIGKCHLDFHGGRNNPLNRSSLREFVRNGFRIENTVTEEINHNGQHVYFSNNSLGIIENNQLVRIWGTQTDISDKTRADQVQQVLYTISNAANSSTDLSELLEIISSQLGKLIDTTNFYIAFYDEKTDRFSIIFEKDEKDEIVSWPAGKSITGYVIRHQKSLLASETDVMKLCEAGEIEIIGTPSKIWLGVPLMLDKSSIGAIVVQSYDNPDAYTEKDQLMLEFISDQISILIERKKAEQEIKAALTKAQESDRLKSAFLANMSHEIRTPLNAIIGFSELIRDPDFEPEQQDEFAQLINDSGNNLLSILSDIMDISKIEAGQVQVRKSKFSINPFMASVQKEFARKAIKKGIELRLDPSNPKEDLGIESDETRIRQIIANFLGNAIKFTETGYIELGFKTTENFIQFHVKDTGIGIPQAYHDKIFERFRQVETSNTRKYGGNGLGLSISKSLVELLGGTIWMESEEGEGSTFYFMIPRN
ncbi:MAG TPA: hypothetical protein DCR40_19725 [Prolixibacteraceae bacterium]|nr:hypothetical protein [Prolixibacteraceae bacterium]